MKVDNAFVHLVNDFSAMVDVESVKNKIIADLEKCEKNWKWISFVYVKLIYDIVIS